MPELDIPQTGTTIESGTFGQPVVYRVVSRYASVAARDAETPSGAGETCYVQDIDELQVWDGSQWVTYQPRIEQSTQQVSVDSDPSLDFSGRFEYTWTTDGAVTCSFWLTQGTGGVTPWQAVTFTAAIPTAVRPAGTIYGLTTSYNGAGSGTGSQIRRGIRFQADGVVLLDSTDQTGYPSDVGSYRGTFTYNIGAVAATPPV